jgi:hypothetical protein
MLERRIEPRLLCADLISVHWKDKSGRLRRATANLEDISLSGMCLQLDTPVPRETLLRIGVDPRNRFQARVRYCVFRETGYYLGVQFEPGFRWSQRRFRPKHLLDPRDLLALTLKRADKRRAGDNQTQ